MAPTPTTPLTDSRLPWISLALISLAGLVLRIQMAALNEFPSVDGVLYMDQARQLLVHGRLPFSCFPPGWPLLICGPLAFLDKTDPMALFRAAQAANIACGTLLPVLVFLLLRPRLGAWPAILGSVITAFLPQDIVLAKGDLSEMSYACGLLGSWLLYRRGSRFGAGLMFGFTYLIRPEAVLAAAGLLLHQGWRERRLCLPMLAGLLIPIIPYLIYIKAASGAWGLSSKDVALTLSFEAHPGLSYLGLVGGNLGKLIPLLTGMVGVPLAVLALLGTIRRPGRWVWMLAPLLPVPFVINPMVVRFWQPYLPFFLLGAGLAIRWAMGRFHRPQLVGVFLLVLAVAGLGLAARDDTLWIRRNQEAFYGLKDAGLWLREQGVDEDTLIAAYKPYTSHWAGCRFIKLPANDGTEELVAWARNNGAQYLVANVLVAHTLAPGLEDLLQDPLPDRLAARLTLVNLFQYDIVNHNTALYRIEDPLQP